MSSFRQTDMVEHFGQLFGRHLLLGIAPGIVRINMALDHQSVEIEVDGLLRYIWKGYPCGRRYVKGH